MSEAENPPAFPSEQVEKPTFEQLLEGARIENARGRGAVNCNYIIAAQNRAYPRTCRRCGLGPCPFTQHLLTALRERDKAGGNL